MYDKGKEGNYNEEKYYFNGYQVRQPIRYFFTNSVQYSLDQYIFEIAIFTKGIMVEQCVGNNNPFYYV